MTEKMKFETKDLTQENIAKIGQLFPEVLTETKDENGTLKKVIDFDKLRQILSDSAVDNRETYDFTWVGKKQAILEAATPIRKTLRPCKEESVNWDTTQNLYIEGDNLDVLKLLQESYLGKVKMIYIDPPYNTGDDDLSYEDDFTDTNLKYEEKINTRDENGYRMFTNRNTNGRFHSNWLNMMYSRLKIARDLLANDGLIFISIDDREQENLKKLCEEIFGNFLGILIRKVMEGGKSDSKNFAIEHEYCLVFSKVDKEIINKRQMDKQDHYKERDEYFNERGYFYLKPLENGGLGYIKSLDYPILGPDGEEIYPGGEYGNNGYRWVWSKEKYEQGLRLGMIKFIPSKKDKSKFKVYYKIYEKVDTDGNPNSKELPFGSLYLDKFTNRQGINDLKKLFESRVFKYPKPVSFLTEILKMATTKDSLCLDFFSGSATTAHAVMKLNAEDGGKRKFIMVQLPELTYKFDKNGKEVPKKGLEEAYKAGYKNICEIGKERIRRAAKQIKEEHPESNFDGGFRVFKLADSNMKDVYFSPNEYRQDFLDKMTSNIKEDRNDMDLLYGCMLEWGLPLSYPHTSEKVGSYTVHTVNNGDLMACFDENITEDIIRHIAAKKPLRVVFRDAGFTDSPAKINVGEIFKAQSLKTEVKII